MLYRSTDCRRRGGAAVENLADSASFHSLENTAPSNPGTKNLAIQQFRTHTHDKIFDIKYQTETPLKLTDLKPMNIIILPNRSRLFSDVERLAIVICTSYFPKADLEFEHNNGYDNAMVSFSGKEWCIVRQGSEIMIASVDSNGLSTGNTEIVVEFMANSVEGALIKLSNKFRLLLSESFLDLGL